MTFEEDTGLKLTLENFLDHYRIDPRSIYKFDSFSRLCARADMIDNFEEPIEDVLSKAFGRFASVDSRRWIIFMLRVLKDIDKLDFTKLSDQEKRMLQMFYITIWGKAIEDWGSDEVLENFHALSDSPVILFVWRFLITVSSSMLVMDLLRFFISFWFSFRKLYFSKNFSISFKLSFLLGYSC